MRLEVDRWVSWQDAATLREEGADDFGLMGGWVEGLKWEEYALPDHELSPRLDAVFKSICDLDLKFSGAMHQKKSDGVPVLTDGSVGMFSWRGWADLMAAARNEIEDTTRYSYINFYM